MPYFVINGYPDCPNYMHAIYVAQYLLEHLPNFEYKKIELKSSDWTKHLLQLNRENSWYVSKSPLIWKEINMWGGKKYLIGGLGEFWEYVFCYYGLESRIPKRELEKLAASNLKHFQENLEAEKLKMKKTRKISIMGATNEVMTNLAIGNLLNVPNLGKSEGIFINLYDDLIHNKQKYLLLEDIANTFNDLNIFGDRAFVYIAATFEEAIKDCDILIHVENFKQRIKEKKGEWLDRCFAKMNFLSDVINISHNRHLRVILCNHGPVCFMATCLVEFCTTIRPSNIVAITADEGLSVIDVASKKIGIPVHQFSAPPVWGFVGLNSFVDLRHVVFKGDIYRPNLRSLTAPRGSTLPLGTIKSELRLMPYLIEDYDEIIKATQEKKKRIHSIMQRPPSLSKIRALISLLKLWYAPDRSDDIICLGVVSNGSFGVPHGSVFSQPVMLDEKLRWTPFSKFPLINDLSQAAINECIFSTREILNSFGLLKYYCDYDDESICSNPDCEMALGRPIPRSNEI